MKARRFLKGSFLVYGLIVITFVSIILTGILMFIASSTKVSLQTVSRTEAFHVAEAGVLWYKWYLAHMTDGRTAQQVQTFWNGGTALGVGTPYETTYEDSSGAVGHYRITVTPPVTGSTVISVLSEGWMDKNPDAIRSIRVRFRRPSWSEYTVLANNDIWFGETETVLGKVFSNGGVRMDGYATNTVSSAVQTYSNPSAGSTGFHPGVWSNEPGEISSVYNVPVFQGGKQFPVPAKDFSSIGADLSLMKSDAINNVNGSYYFNGTGGGRHIILKADGTFDIRTVNTFSTKRGRGTDGNSSLIPNLITSYTGAWQNYPIPDNGVIFVENNVWLEGTLNGKKVTVVAANLGGSPSPSCATCNMFIGRNDIRYTNYNGDDNLGIVAQGNIEVIYDSLNNLRIDGALLAQTGRVERSCYGCHGSTVDSKASIYTYGALATNQTYTWNWCLGVACNPHYGFVSTQSEYDNNLYYTPPPYFPTGTQYLMDLWEEL